MSTDAPLANPGGHKDFNLPNYSFNRPPSSFRNIIEKGGKHEPEKNRYHLFVSYGCLRWHRTHSWATRTLIVRKLKGLKDSIIENGWPFANVESFPGADRDPLYDSSYIKEIYLKAEPNFTGRQATSTIAPHRVHLVRGWNRFTVHVLWDKELETIVNNESSEIIRIFNELLPLGDKAALDLYPESLRKEIGEIIGWLYDTINNSVYKTGFATTQKAYEDAVIPLFQSLEKILTDKDYLIGGQLTEADVRLFVTIIRFDTACRGAFKCNLRTIRDRYPAIDLWLRKLYWKNAAFSESTDFKHIKHGYYAISKVSTMRGLILEAVGRDASARKIELGPIRLEFPLSSIPTQASK